MTVCAVACAVGLIAPAYAAAQPTSAAGRSVSADTYITTTCAGQPMRVPVTWYLPNREPTGLVWLQHGFSRTAKNLGQLAGSLSDDGLLVAATTLRSINLSGCAVALNSVDNTAFVKGLATAFGAHSTPGSPVFRSLERAAKHTRSGTVVMPQKMVFAGHSAGGEVALTAANQLRMADPGGYHILAGLMLFDPVNSFFGNNFQAATVDLGAARLPIRVIASQPSMSNIAGLGVWWLEQGTRQKFLGVRLTTGIHIDVEGDTTDLIGEASELAVPRPRNGRVLRRLSGQWISDMLTGDTSTAYYPGGDYYRLLIHSHTVTTLPVG
ncbi:alpha/beta hydrolase [Gordonia rhizosphera]|uniref:Alpha/beta hydrolase n=1 Tax=Gordonia rhizosphera NBRC 16068 TaxID=1108045 RepID=K6WA20_9ACTN|nr:alpha/beta hydrolase [Gordonia rhizosphera]GAB89057.1 hypothetical protein GORHZ_048_00340 [Gordonia rhizosphera NBRC 16068]